MKRLIVLAILTLGFSAQAQEKPAISSAVIAINRQPADIAQAKKYIDEAQAIIDGKSLSDVKEKDLAKFYFHKGLINYRIHTSPDTLIQALDPNALDKALDGFTKLIAFEEKVDRDRYTDDAKNQLQYLANDIARRGIAASQNGDYMGAYDDFLKTYNLKKEMTGYVDSSMYYNAGLMAQQNKSYDLASKIYVDLLAMNYRGTRFVAISAVNGDTVDFASADQMMKQVEAQTVTNPSSFGDVRPSLYTTLIYLSLEQGDTVSYKKYLTEGRQKFPNNIDILKAELQLFFDNKEYDKALANLDQAIAADPTNAMMYYNKGVILQTEMKRVGAALDAYKKTLEVDPEYTDALYMSSIIYIDSANAIGQKMNDLPYNATKKYEALEKTQMEVYNGALPFLEKAYEKNKEDEQVKNALAQVYRALKMYDKFKAITEE